MSITTTTADTGAVAFFFEHAGYSYMPPETAQQGRERCSRELAAAEAAFRADPDVFVVWEVDDIDSTSFDPDSEPRPLWVAMMCVEVNRRDEHGIQHPGRGEVLAWDSEILSERSGRVVESLGGIDISGTDDPYARVIVAEMYAEFEARREANIHRSEN